MRIDLKVSSWVHTIFILISPHIINLSSDRDTELVNKGALGGEASNRAETYAQD